MMTPLHRAASRGQNNVVSYLLTLPNIDPNARDNIDYLFIVFTFHH